MTYSWPKNSGNCLPCVIFARGIDIRKGKGVLVETAFTNFKNMSEVCALHAAREYHKDVIAVCDAFVERMSSKRERRSKRNHPEQQKESLLYYRDNCLV